ncbi:MAG: ROK family protein, partial [Sphaerochaetaceae bacterium]|nr:ROK family protein [Sphaerochaetaceae bacterium]
VEQETGFKAFIMNRYSLEGVAAYKFGNPNRIKDFLYIGVGSGIRSAIYSDGRLIDGASFSAGRISHMPIIGNKRKCSCGRTGCLITVANSKALMEYAQMDIEINQLRMLADKGDSKACQAYDKIAEPLTEIITTLLDLLDPKMVVLGGPVGNSQYLISTINSKLSKAKSDRLHTGILVQKESFEYSASAIGASSLVADRLLEIIFKTVKENKGQARSNL